METLSTPPVTDFAAVKLKQQAAWSPGDYAVVGTTLQIVGETLCEALDLRAGERVLDVAAGTGNATLAAARRCAMWSRPTTWVRCSHAGRREPAPRAWRCSFRKPMPRIFLFRIARLTWCCPPSA